MQDPQPTDPPNTEWALVEHRDFMLRVARDVCGWRLADDVVQEASLRALENPARHEASLRAWLAAIVRNTSYEMLRSEARRRRREELAAREERLPVEGGLVDEATLHAIVREALDQLREPYRNVLVSRLVDDLSPPEIARRSGAPLETVRAQLRRGRWLLRAELDRRGGGRREWTIALIAVLGLRAPRSSATLRPRFSPVGAWAAIAVGVLGTTWLALGPRLERNEVAAIELARSTALERDAELSSAAAPIASRRAEVSAEPTAPFAVLTGRVVERSGNAAFDARVHALPAHEEEVLRLPFERTSLASVDVGVDGRFSLAVPALPVLLVASGSAGLTREALRVEAQPPPFELELEPTELLIGRVVGSTGLPVAGAEVELFKREAYPGLRQRSLGDAAVFLADLPLRTASDANGRFELPRIEGGGSALWAHDAARGEAVLALSGHEVNADLELVLGARADIELEVDRKKGTVQGVRVELFGSSGGETRVGWTDAEGRCGFEGLPGWRSFVAVLTRDDLATTVSLPRGFHDLGEWTMPIVRSRELALQVLDGRDRSVEGARVVALLPIVKERTRAAGFPATLAQRVATIHETRTDALGRARIPRGAADPLIVSVEAGDGLPTGTVYVPAGREELVVQLADPEASPLVLRGRVVDEDGSPLRAFRVRSLAFDGPELRAGAWLEVQDDQGSFTWSEPRGNAFLLEVEAPDRPRRRSWPVPTVDVPAEVEIVLQAERNLDLRLVDARRRPLSRTLVLLERGADAPVLVRSRPGERQTRFFTDRVGRARVQGLPSTVVRLQVPIAGIEEPVEVEVDLRDERTGELLLELPVVFPRATETRRIVLELPDERRVVRMRASTADGKQALDRRFLWKDGAFSALGSPAPRFLVEEDGRLPRQVAESASPAVGLEPVCGLLDARRAFVDLELPADEPVTFSIGTSGLSEVRMLEPGSGPDPLLVRLPRRSR